MAVKNREIRLTTSFVTCCVAQGQADRRKTWRFNSLKLASILILFSVAAAGTDARAVRPRLDAPIRATDDARVKSPLVCQAVRQAGAAASGMARAAARAVWTMLGGRHVEETTEKSGPPRAGDHGEPGEAATGDG